MNPDAKRRYVFESWDKLLNPDKLEGTLLVTSLFLAAYEILHDSLVGQLRRWYCAFTTNEVDELSEYRDRVLSLHKNKWQASLLWFKNRSAISEEDIAVVKQAHRHRNELAHELPRFLCEADAVVDQTLLVEMVRVVCTLDRWWIREMEMPCNADFDNVDVDAIPDSEISSGNILFMDILLRLVTEDRTTLRERYIKLMETCERLPVAKKSPLSDSAPLCEESTE